MSRRRIAIIDVSQSMSTGFSARLSRGKLARRTERSQKFQAALDHLQFAIQKMPSRTELIIIAFAESANVVFQGSVEDTARIAASIRSLTPTGGATNLASALELAFQLVEPSPQRIQTLDVVTDGLSNQGDPIPPARALQRECAVYIHIYLIDPTNEGMTIARHVVGNEGEVDPVASETELMGRQRNRLREEEEEIRRLERTVARHQAERADFMSAAPPQQQRPRITVSYPEVLPPKRWKTVDVFIYAPEFSDAVKSHIQKTNQLENQEYGSVSGRFPRGIPEGCAITVRLTSTTLKINPSQITIQWYEPCNRLPFRIAALDDFPDGSFAELNAEILADELPISSMQASIIIDPEAHAKTAVAQSTAQLYENVFASYAREDLSIVRHLKARYEALGIYMFIDVEDLRGGTIWRRELFERIDQSDLFQLFWSHASSNSEYVAIEWQHAIKAAELKGGRFIRPVYWQEPMPEAPTGLSHINFRKLDFMTNIESL